VAVLIEDANQSDRAAIMQLVSECGLPIDGLADHLGNASVARLGDRVVGCAALEMYSDGALLRSVAVAAEHRGIGIGEQLARSALRAAHRAGANDVYLLTTTAERYFARFGFNQIDRTQVPSSVKVSVEFQSACPASAIVMHKALAGEAQGTAQTET
jgi:amino-acid N-acetyltransferase